jgi:hypothetical protein
MIRLSVAPLVTFYNMPEREIVGVILSGEVAQAPTEGFITSSAER